MAVQFVQRKPAVEPTPPRAVALVRRKIAMCGSHGSSLTDAPWTDPSWEFWGHASARDYYSRSLDRYFDLHPKSVWVRPPKGDGYVKWLGRNTVPIYMQERYPEVPASYRYPKGRVLQEFGTPRAYFTNQLSWMIALALTEGATTIGLWGISYSARSEYGMQRGCAEYWLGRAVERGVQLVLPDQCTLLREPGQLYGYESHNEETGKLVAEYQKQQALYLMPPREIKQAQPTPEIREMIEREEREFPRPDWAMKEAL